MLWTDDAIASLRKLAVEGWSASVIAETLGAESRNAVIGKANRIGIRLNGGLGGRASAPARPARPPQPSPPAALPHREPAPGAVSRSPAPPREPARRLAWTFADAEVGEMRRVTFMDMREFACRWPLGDPRSGDFAYCGLRPAEGRAYCAGHCRMAYRPPNARSSHSLGNSWRRA